MATLTIRNINAAVKDQLRVQAARNGRSMEAELRAIITDAVNTKPHHEVNLAEAIRRRFAPFGGVDNLEAHPRVPVRNPPVFDY
ncbi:FitA-like ribbon-helix-helix domain-containing protein [Rhodopila sp.]|uniref:FitA-like ribbon-helix-helix domain-containing protein n=1 Tax=Rhodopila sp. TaxID=2480087 RepID=UPI003D0A7D48